jgi:geranylgeranyl diphosphate synthase type II
LTSELVREVLDEYGSATKSRLLDYLPDAEPRRYLYDLCGDYPRRGGRGMRPSLCIAAARAFGRPAADALLTAVSIELMHNAMLIHDDIEDESERRRGLPALHVSVGVPLAINVGDALCLLSFRPLLDNQSRLGRDLSLQLLRATERMARESAEGQAMELGWRRDNPTDVTEDQYLLMVLKKTCWLATIHPLQAGALIGSGRRAPLEAIARFGYLLGTAFQIQDDLLNLVGDEASYGKELAGDIYEGKRTLMLIRLFALATPDERSRLREFLGLPREARSEADVRWVLSRMNAYACVEHARCVAQALAGAARHECELAFGALKDSRDKRFLQALPSWVIQRN